MQCDWPLISCYCIRKKRIKISCCGQSAIKRLNDEWRVTVHVNAFRPNEKEKKKEFALHSFSLPSLGRWVRFAAHTSLAVVDQAVSHTQNAVAAAPFSVHSWMKFNLSAFVRETVTACGKHINVFLSSCARVPMHGHYLSFNRWEIFITYFSVRYDTHLAVSRRATI